MCVAKRQARSASACQSVLDAMEASVQQLAALNASVVRTTCEMVEANPFIPSPARHWVIEAAQPINRLATMQQHLIAAWFGMARQLLAGGGSPYEHRAAPRSVRSALR
jgi:hypothetical protein